MRGPESESTFVALFDLIQEYGVVEQFKPTRRWFKYLYANNGYPYWAVDDIPQAHAEEPDLDQCVIINRAKSLR